MTLGLKLEYSEDMPVESLFCCFLIPNSNSNLQIISDNVLRLVVSDITINPTRRSDFSFFNQVQRIIESHWNLYDDFLPIIK